MKIRHSTGLAAAIAAVSAFSIVAVAVAQQHGAAPVTKSLQEHPVTAEDPRLRTFYDLLVEARAKGVEKVDAGLEKKIREMARGYPAGHGLDQKGWEDHVVDMAGQMLAIGRQDPKIFQSYENFVIGLRGPQ